MKIFVMRFFVAIAIMILCIYGWLSLTRAEVSELPVLQTGDIVLQTTNTPQTLAILAASLTVYSHIGIVDVKDDGSITVIDAAEPVREVPLQDWIDQGIAGRVTIKRFPGLNEAQKQSIVTAAREHMGKPYDYLFRFDRETIYCSELVYMAFHDGANIALGQVQHVRELNVDNAAVRKVIEQRWQQHPGCIASQAMTMQACYDQIMAQELITPVSVAQDNRLTFVFSNYTPW